MLTSTLPELIKPIKLARQGLILKGTIPLEQMKRLTADAFASDGIVDVDAAFIKDGEGYPLLQGIVKTCVQLQCQRCLQGVDVKLEVELTLAFVTKESRLEQVPSIYEAILLDSEEISLVKLLEDELILLLPIMAYHDNCEAYQYRTDEELKAEKEGDLKPENPFDVLKQLKSNK
ncbi:hypothetical protein A9Q81_04470 [Gammaproteobacteria bacterium 42_54_T18]|nr:hypothetical protein A9Q81_04470 [Gammaproteobacteria bacterium 42_54_T18]